MIRKYAEIFCWKNVSSFCTHIFSAKNIRKLYKTVNELTLNELVKLTMLWTTGPCIFCFWTITRVLIGKFHQCLTVLSAHHRSILSFPHDNLSKYQLIFIKLGICIDIMDIWFRTADGQISSIFDRVICPWDESGGILLFYFFYLFIFFQRK